MALYGVTVETEEGTEFYALGAAGEDEAQQAVLESFGEPYELCDLEDLLGEQYNGLALLGTT